MRLQSANKRWFYIFNIRVNYSFPSTDSIWKHYLDYSALPRQTSGVHLVGGDCLAHLNHYGRSVDQDFWTCCTGSSGRWCPAEHHCLSLAWVFNVDPAIGLFLLAWCWCLVVCMSITKWRCWMAVVWAATSWHDFYCRWPLYFWLFSLSWCFGEHLREYAPMKAWCRLRLCVQALIWFDQRVYLFWAVYHLCRFFRKTARIWDIFITKGGSGR